MLNNSVFGLAMERQGMGGMADSSTLDGSTRSPLPFTILSRRKQELQSSSTNGHVALFKSSHQVPTCLWRRIHSSSTMSQDRSIAPGPEPRGQVIRLTQTLRGGDRPKGAEDEFAEVTVMPKSAWEPWVLFRKPISEGTVMRNLRRWRTGGATSDSPRNPSAIIASSPTHARLSATSPSSFPQAPGLPSPSSARNPPAGRRHGARSLCRQRLNPCCGPGSRVRINRH